MATVEFTEEQKLQLKEKFKAWIDLDDHIRKEKTLLRELKKKQGVLTSSITKFLGDHEIDFLRIVVDGSPVIYKKTDVKAPITLKEVKERLATLTGGEQGETSVPVPTIPKLLFDGERPTRQSVVLSRKLPRHAQELTI